MKNKIFGNFEKNGSPWPRFWGKYLKIVKIIFSSFTENQVCPKRGERWNSKEGPFSILYKLLVYKHMGLYNEWLIHGVHCFENLSINICHISFGNPIFISF